MTWLARYNIRYSYGVKQLSEGVIMSFQIGEQVRLKDGSGPCMTVIGTICGKDIACCWFDGKELQESIYTYETLTHCEAIDQNARMLQEILNLNTI